MQTYLINFGNNLDTFIPAMILGIIIASIIVGLIMTVRGRWKLDRLRNDLASEKSAEIAQHTEAIEEFNHVQEQLKEQLNEKVSHIGLIEKEQQVLKDQVAYGTKLEEHLNQNNQQVHQLLENLETIKQKAPKITDIWANQLWQWHNKTILQLNQRLLDDVKIQSELEQSNQIAMEELTKKEKEKKSLASTLTEKKQKISDLKQILVTQKSTLVQLEEDSQKSSEELNENLVRINELEQRYSRVNDELEMAQQKVQQLEKILKKDQLFDHELVTTINELQQTVTGQKNHISRVEYNLEIKELMLHDKDYDLQGIPLTILERQKQDQLRITELEAILASENRMPQAGLETILADANRAVIAKLEEPVSNENESISAMNIIERTQRFPEDIKRQLEQKLVNPFKKQMGEITENVQNLPRQTLEKINQGWVNPVKEQINTTTKRVKQLPDQLKDIFQQKFTLAKT